MDKTVVTLEPTEKRTGRKDVSCTKCGYTKTETIDKLPHTHVWYTLDSPNMWVWQNGIQVPNPKFWGSYGDCHYFRCKSCDAVKKENHSWEFWTVSAGPTADNTGAMWHRCLVCYYSEYKTFPQGTYPILTIGAKTDKAYAKPGEKVTITYDAKAAQYGFEDEKYAYPVKLKEWHDLRSWDGSDKIPYGKEWIDVPRLTFANATAQTTTFTMPNGPATVVSEVEKCTHSRYGLGEQMEPTCTLYGQTPSRVCLDCGTVLIPGDPIAPLGHDPSATPIAGTTIVNYCTVSYDNQPPHPNPENHGYDGDHLCNRCGKTVKGKNVPLNHGCRHVSAGNVRVLIDYHEENAVNETCTKDGYFPDLVCDYCGKVATKGHKTERTGHEWGEWEVVREASKTTKGLEKRVCIYDENHQETRATEYSGPDHRLKADKTKLVFRFTNGETVASQTITFTSQGRNRVLSIDDAEMGGPGNQLSVDGLKLTIKVSPQYLDELLEVPAEQRVGRLISVDTEDGVVDDFTAPEFTYSVQVVKSSHNLILPNTVYIGRPGRKFMSPQLMKAGGKMFKPTVANVKVRWTSSDNRVATVNPETGEVTPLSAGDVKIYANFEGDRFYKSEKVYYQMKVIGEQEFAGSLWQIYKDPRSGTQVTSGPTAHTLKLAPSKKTAGNVDVSFGSITLAQTKDKLSPFTVAGVGVQDNADGKVYYELPIAQTLRIGTFDGLAIAKATTRGWQGTPTGFPLMVLNLTVGNKDNILIFAPEGRTQQEVLTLIREMETGLNEVTTDNGQQTTDIYDLQGRKLEHITQPGIYIEGRKKTKK